MSVCIMVCMTQIKPAEASTCFLPSNDCTGIMVETPRSEIDVDCTETAPKAHYVCEACGDSGYYKCNGCESGYTECSGECVKTAPANGKLVEAKPCYVQCNDGYVKEGDVCLVRCGSHETRNSSGGCSCVNGYEGSPCHKVCQANAHAVGDTCVCDNGYTKCDNGTCLSCPAGKTASAATCACLECTNTNLTCAANEQKIRNGDGSCSCVADCEKQGFTVKSSTKVKKCKMSSISFSAKVSFAEMEFSEGTDPMWCINNGYTTDTQTAGELKIKGWTCEASPNNYCGKSQHCYCSTGCVNGSNVCGSCSSGNSGYSYGDSTSSVSICSGYHAATNQDWAILYSTGGACEQCPQDSRYMKNCHCVSPYVWDNALGTCKLPSSGGGNRLRA